MTGRDVMSWAIVCGFREVLESPSISLSFGILNLVSKGSIGEKELAE